VTSSSPTAPWVAADSTWDSCITSDRDIRSAITPPIRRNTIIGIIRAASTAPSAVAESLMSSTANTTAIGAITEPTVEMKRPA